MACKHTNIDCGCKDSFLTTPAPCPTPEDCPEAQPCSEVFDAQCIIYNGADIECDDDIVVESGATVAEALNNIVEYACNNLGGFTHYIGEEFGGGVIFHLWRDSQGVEHGLIVDTTDLSASEVFSNVTSSLSVVSSWDGLSNSNAIVAQPGHTNSAAALCLNSTNGGQNDWYLPSTDEMSLLWQNCFNINKTLSGIIGTDVIYNKTYWTSTEYAAASAWAYNFLNGNTYGSGFLPKIVNSYVRAIRAF